jgi:hypothetical protein
MFVPFHTLPGQARVWVYQSNRPWQAPAEAQLARTLTAFCETWAAHGAPLRASFQALHRQFIVLAADETAQHASGCSIDASVQILKQVQQPLGIDLFDRRQAAFLIDGQVVLYPIDQVAKQIASGALQESTLYFNNVVPDVGTWKTEWLLPLGRSWLQRFMPKPAAQV